MTEISFNFLINLFFFLSFPFIGGYLAVKYKLSPLIGYILGGIIMGLFFSQRFSHDFLSNIAVLGLSILVFAIGMEVDFKSIKMFGKFVLWGGLIQLGASAILIFVLSVVFGFNLIESFFFGFAFALSSTAVVAKIIQDKGEESSFLGGITIGILILQDIALIPLIIIFSSFSKDASFINVSKSIILNSIKAGVLLVSVYFIGETIMPFMLDKVANISQEIFNLFIILFIVGSLALFSWLHISVLLAAFLAGILLNKTLEQEQVFSQIRTVRDLLAIVFFVTLGIGINLYFVFTHSLSILIFVLFLVLIKFLVVLILFLAFRFHTKTAFLIASYLFEVGEGAFIIIYQGLQSGVISSDSYNFAVSTVVITLLLTPFIINYNDKLYSIVRKFTKKFFPFIGKFISYKFDRESPNISILPYKNHVVICGYGRVGRYIGRALTLAKIPFVAVDYNLQIVKRARSQGVNIIYGDPTNIDILDYLEVDNASILISAIPNKKYQEQVVIGAKKLNPKIIIFTRVHRKEDQQRMRDLNVDVIIHPEFEASLSIIRKILLYKRFSKDDVKRKIKRLKIEHGIL